MTDVRMLVCQFLRHFLMKVNMCKALWGWSEEDVKERESSELFIKVVMYKVYGDWLEMK